MLKFKLICLVLVAVAASAQPPVVTCDINQGLPMPSELAGLRLVDGVVLLPAGPAPGTYIFGVICRSIDGSVSRGHRFVLQVQAKPEPEPEPVQWQILFGDETEPDLSPIVLPPATEGEPYQFDLKVRVVPKGGGSSGPPDLPPPPSQEEE